MATVPDDKFAFAIDRGGTFTDVWALCPGGKERVLKLLSEDPKHYKDAPTEAIRRILEQETGQVMPRSCRISTERIAWIRMGTTVATNALLERKGQRTALAVTSGFRDLLYIGNQARPNIFDLRVECPDVLYEDVVEVHERLLPALKIAEDYPEVQQVEGSTGERLLLLKELDEELLREDLTKVLAKGVSSLAVLLLHSYTYPEHEQRVEAIAREVGFTHVSLSSSVSAMVKAVPRGYTACSDAYLTPVIREYLQGFKSGFENDLEGVRVLFMQSDGGLTLMEKFIGSRAILSGPAGGVVGYAATTCHQLRSLKKSFTPNGTGENSLPIEQQKDSTSSPDTKEENSLPIEQQKGSTSSPDSKEENSLPIEQQKDSTSSSPDTQDSSTQKPSEDDPSSMPVIGFDMGGTSTDVSRYAGVFEHVFESTVAGITLQSPQLDINTVAAGGGSRLFFQSGLFVVGPESAGANPGPVCYKKGGPLAVTDANLLLGRLLPEHFPRIFGPTEDQPLDADASRKAFEELAITVNDLERSRGSDKTLSPEEVAFGFIKVANETMCRPIRALTEAKGHDTSRHVLSVFGGAGGQHACAIARSLGMRRVFIHRYAGILSAYGLALADTVHDMQVPCAKIYEPQNFEHLRQRLQELEEECRRKLVSEGFPASSVRVETFLHLRYKGTDCALMCPPAAASGALDVAVNGESSSSEEKSHVSAEDEQDIDEGNGIEGYGRFMKSFLERYYREFGFVLKGRAILVDDVRVRGVAASGIQCRHTVASAASPPQPLQVSPVYLEKGMYQTPVYRLEDLRAGHFLPGPAVVLDNLSTILIEPACQGEVTDGGNILIEIGTATADNNKLATKLDPIQLSIFSHRFMSLAEQMGRVLQRTSISTNIKERLDFSCAVFGPDGGLVSNAPHIPVHLGAMQETVQYQLRELGDDLEDGDVLLSNHPAAGGSHLPDLTVITPVFNKERKKPIFYVASRGHHADIGGITPGSMPPHSTSIHEEGAVFYSFKLVKRKVFQEAELKKVLMAPGKIPGSSGTRNLEDNISDLKAQIAANRKGIQLVNELIEQYGLKVVQAYMGHIQTSAEMAVRHLLREVGERHAGDDGKATLSATEYMDDGTPIVVTITIDPKQGTAVIDFDGTGIEVWGNCNAPRAVTVSAVIYCLRCMVGHDTPLNQGCLAPITIKIKDGCILQPSPEAAVVGGNVQTSQRVVDVLLKAFGACAASQGCMNNITFGDDTIGYYETVAGGAGAGPNWHGRSGVHTHMTNTRITDPEILEIRYPIYLKTFTVNRGTGGRGRYRGGDGVVRELQFRKQLTLSLLTERRVFCPYGLRGGGCGRRGQNILVKRGGRTIRLPSKSSVLVEPEDTFRLETPGGGGYGSADDSQESPDARPVRRLEAALKGSVHDYSNAQLMA